MYVFNRRKQTIKSNPPSQLFHNRAFYLTFGSPSGVLGFRAARVAATETSVSLEVSRHRPHNFLIASAIFNLVSGIYDSWVVFHSFLDV